MVLYCLKWFLEYLKRFWSDFSGSGVYYIVLQLKDDEINLIHSHFLYLKFLKRVFHSIFVLEFLRWFCTQGFLLF